MIDTANVINIKTHTNFDTGEIILEVYTDLTDIPKISNEYIERMTLNTIRYDTDFLQIGDFTIETYHEEECCEQVYADFTALRDTTFEDTIKEMSEITKEKIIQNIEKNEYGISIFGFFVPCYNNQNGYYSNDLELGLFYKGKKIYELDITDCTLYGDG